jgi:SAM-dependent methyltransferase
MGRSKFADATDRAERTACPICGQACGGLIASAEDVAAEIALRREFFLTRLEGPIDERELRDLTEMTTNDAAAIHLCGACGVLVRADPKRTPRRFACDEYDEHTLHKLHELHVATFVGKSGIRDLLPAGSRVLEIGSYVGGFLEAARRWGWNATGVDIGRDTAEFTREKGFDVTTERFERNDFGDTSFDGVFIWNCFEQLTNPDEVLAIVGRIAKPGAPLVIYVPDAAVYRAAEQAFAEGEPRHEASPIVQQLAYNNLLGFPHHFGYSSESLTRLVESAGFERCSIESLPAIRPLRERLTRQAREEEERVGPAWLEITGWLRM